MNLTVIITVVLWQIAWWAGILPVVYGQPLLGALVPLVMVLIHLLYRRPARAWLVLGCALLAACAIDGILSWLGLVEYKRAVVPAPLPALWIVASWLLFAAGMQRTMDWIRGRWLAGVVFGAVGGALAYWGVSRLGAISFPQGISLGMTGVACAYALAVPALMVAAFGGKNFYSVESVSREGCHA